MFFRQEEAAGQKTSVAPVREVTGLGVLARVRQERQCVHSLCSLVSTALEVSDVEGQDLYQNGHDVDCLTGDKDKEPGVVASANASIKPGTVMIIALHTLIAHIAVVASRQGHNLALEAEFVDGKALK